MIRKRIFQSALLAAVTGMFGAANAQAADLTDVLDAADQVYLEDELVDDPFDIALDASFKQRHEWSKLKREYRDDARNLTRLLNELEYERIINTLDLNLEIGMFHDLSFRMNVPIVISDQQKYRFDTSSDEDDYKINKSKSWFSPYQNSEDRPYTFFDLNDNETLNGVKRAGLGDMSFGIAWSPYNTERNYIPDRPWKDETGRSTITLAFDYVAPTGTTHAIDNDAVGSGVHEFIFSVASSHRFSFVDPYIGLKFGLPVATDDIHTYGGNQKRTAPGMWGRIDMGIEFLPYESLHKDFQRLVKIDLRGYLKYNAEGRSYSELGDAFGTGDCYKVDDAGSMPSYCSWVGSKWSNAGSNYLDFANGARSGISLKEDGYFDYEGYATLGGALNLTVQPVQYVQIRAGVAADYVQNHFVTFTNIGRDKGTYDDDGKKVSNNKDGFVNDAVVEERNPAYSESLDRSGSRIKRTETFNLEWFVGVKLMY